MENAGKLVSSYKYWYHDFEVLKGVWTNGQRRVPDKEGILKLYDIPGLKGKRVLDVATFDGGYAFAFEDLGAEVVAIDIIDESDTGFHIAKKARGSGITFRNISIYDASPEDLGTFDYIHFSGIHYHLKNPYLAFDSMNSLLKAGGIVFGQGTGGEGYFRNFFPGALWPIIGGLFKKIPLMMPLCARTSPRNDPTNWFMFNDKALQLFFERCGFDVGFIKSHYDRTSRISFQRFKARKINTPDPEYWTENHMRRLIDGRSGIT